MTPNSFSQARAQITPQINHNDATAVDVSPFAAGLRSQDAPPSPVAAAINALSDEIGQLEKNMSVLCDRITPVTSPPVPEASGDHKNTAREPAPCDVGDQIEISSRRIANLNLIVNSLVNRLYV